MTKNKGIGFSVFIMILTIFLVLSVIFTFSISYMFSTEGISGKLFGKYVYIMDSADMTPEIEKGSAVISDADGISVLVEGNVILFKNGRRENVMRIRQVVHNTESTVYIASPDARPQETIEVSKDKVIAKCTTEGKNLGGFISFLSSVPGIIIFMIIPCMAILAMLIIKILSMKKSGGEEENDMQGMPEMYDDGDEDDDDDEFTGFNGRQMRSSPLFDPESDIDPGEEFILKKSSIAQNFGRKPGAPPQRPARGKHEAAPKAAVERFKAAVEEKPHVPVSKKTSLVPENVNPVRDEKLAAIKAALSNQDDDPYGMNSYNGADGEDKTVAFRALKPQKVTPDKNQRIVGAPMPKKKGITSYIDQLDVPAKKPAPAKKPSPAPAAKPAASKGENINSIDDLIKALEEEKRKL